MIGTFIAPGAYSRELDYSSYTLMLSASICAMVGPANWGPVNKRTFLPNVPTATRIFGSQTPKSYFMYSIKEFLSEGNLLWGTRISDGTDTRAEVQVPAMETSASVVGNLNEPFQIVAALPAVVTGTESGDFVVDTNRCNLLVSIDGTTPQPITIPNAQYSANTLAALLNSLTEGVRVSSNQDQQLVWTTNSRGETSSIVFLDTENSANKLLGLEQRNLWQNSGVDDLSHYETVNVTVTNGPLEPEHSVELQLNSWIINEQVLPNFWTDMQAIVGYGVNFVAESFASANTLEEVRESWAINSYYKRLTEFLAAQTPATTPQSMWVGAIGNLTAKDLVLLNINEYLRKAGVTNIEGWWNAMTTNTAIDKDTFLNILVSATSWNSFQQQLKNICLATSIEQFCIQKGITLQSLYQNRMPDAATRILYNLDAWLDDQSEAFWTELSAQVGIEKQNFLITLATSTDTIMWQSKMTTLGVWDTFNTWIATKGFTSNQVWSNRTGNVTEYQLIDQWLDGWLTSQSVVPAEFWEGLQALGINRVQFVQAATNSNGDYNAFVLNWSTPNGLTKLEGWLATLPQKMTAVDLYNAKEGQLNKHQMYQVNLALWATNASYSNFWTDFAAANLGTVASVAGTMVEANDNYETWLFSLKANNLLSSIQAYLGTTPITLNALWENHIGPDSGNVGSMLVERSGGYIFQNLFLEEGTRLQVGVDFAIVGLGGVNIEIWSVSDIAGSDAELVWTSPTIATRNAWMKLRSLVDLDSGHYHVRMVGNLADDKIFFDNWALFDSSENGGSEGNDLLSLRVNDGPIQSIRVAAGERTTASLIEELKGLLKGLEIYRTQDGSIQLLAASGGANSSLQILPESTLDTVVGWNNDLQHGQLNGDAGVLQGYWTGTEGNKVQVSISKGANYGFRLAVIISDVVVEAYDNLSRDPSHMRFWVDVVNKASESSTAGSNWIRIVHKDGSIVNPSYGTYKLSGGSDGMNGITASHYVGTDSPATGIQMFSNSKVVDINLICCPGMSDASVLAALDKLCTTRGDCFFVFDCPNGMTPQAVADWHNGIGWNHAAFDTSFGALYYPWIVKWDADNNQEMELPPSAFLCAIMARTDRVAGMWFPPAGYRRGKVVGAIRTTYPEMSEGDISLLIGNQNAVNCIVDDTTDGIVVMTQKTLQRAATSLDRIGPRRTLLYLRKTVATSTKYLTHEPNDSFTWNEWYGMCQPIYERVKRGRGLYDYKLQCDEITNTNDLLDNNIMRGISFLKFTKYSEIIINDMVVTKTGATFSEVIV